MLAKPDSYCFLPLVLKDNPSLAIAQNHEGNTPLHMIAIHANPVSEEPGVRSAQIAAITALVEADATVLNIKKP